MTWRPAPPVLPQHDLHLWRIPITSPTTSHYDALTDEEHARAARYRAEHARDAFVCGRSALRRTLARFLHLDRPQDVELTTREREKPCLAHTDLEFNLSHSHDWALLGITRKGPLGVDVDFEGRNTDHEQLARRVFSTKERTAWGMLAPQDRRKAFYRVWTRKEAYLKALGMGLTIELGQVSVSLGPEASLDEATHPSADRDHWDMISFEVAPGYPGAVVAPRPIGDVGMWELDPAFAWRV